MPQHQFSMLLLSVPDFISRKLQVQVPGRPAMYLQVVRFYTFVSCLCRPPFRSFVIFIFFFLSLVIYLLISLFCNWEFFPLILTLAILFSLAYSLPNIQYDSASRP